MVLFNVLSTKTYIKLKYLSKLGALGKCIFDTTKHFLILRIKQHTHSQENDV